MATIKLPEKLSKSFYDLSKEKIFNHTCQLLIKGGQYGYTPWGTGVLVGLEDNFYIFTAAHVTECINERTFLFVNTTQGLLPISGELNETDLSHDENVDVAFIRLDKNLVEILKLTYEFLPSNKICINHEPEATTQYLSLGFPEKNIKIDKENHIIKTGSSSFLHKLKKDKVYEKYKFEKSLHFIVDYAGKGYDLLTNEKKSIIRRPHGMSGCGLWFISFKGVETDFKLEYSLIGIMTEYIEKPFDVLIGSKVNVIIDGINNSY